MNFLSVCGLIMNFLLRVSQFRLKDYAWGFKKSQEF